MKHMFTLEELQVSSGVSTKLTHSNHDQEDPASMLEIKEDIREECAKLGVVTNVVLFDKEEAGVASVKFASAEAASACVKVGFALLLDEMDRLIWHSSCMGDGLMTDNLKPPLPQETKSSRNPVTRRLVWMMMKRKERVAGWIDSEHGWRRRHDTLVTLHDENSFGCM